MSSEELIYFKIDTDKIYLTRRREQNTNIISSTVTLVNLTDSYLLFKVYINKQKIYSTNPSTSFIPPRGKVDVTIKRQDTNEEVISGDTFKFAAYPTEEVVTDVSEYIYIYM